MLDAIDITAGFSPAFPDLSGAIETYLAAHGEDPKPFQWIATPDQILEKVRRGRVTLDAITNQNRDGPLG